MDALFTNIQIQTITACTRKCAFCPKASQTKPRGVMAQFVFDKVVDDLRDLGYSGRVSPDLNGEPLLDRRLPEWIGRVRQACPQSYIMINSNGDRLERGLLLALINAGLNCLTINCYDNTAQFEQRQELVGRIAQEYGSFEVLVGASIDWEYRRHDPAGHYVVVRDCSHYCLESPFLTSRAGNVRSKVVQESLPASRCCARPSNQMYINYRGQAVLCSEDWQHEAVLGDVLTDSLEAIWQGPSYRQYRAALSRADRSLPVCRRCDL